MELRDLDGIHVVWWSFGAGSLAGLAWRLRHRKTVTTRMVVGGCLSSGLVGVASALAVRSYVPDKPEVWLSLAIVLGLSGTDGVRLAIGVLKRMTKAAFGGSDSDPQD